MDEPEPRTSRFAGLLDGVNCGDQRSIWIGNYNYRELCLVRTLRSPLDMKCVNVTHL